MKHVHVGLPAAMVEEIDAIVNMKTMGYSSRADFVREACRKAIIEWNTRTVEVLGQEAYWKLFPPEKRIHRHDSDEF